MRSPFTVRSLSTEDRKKGPASASASGQSIHPSRVTAVQVGDHASIMCNVYGCSAAALTGIHLCICYHRRCGVGTKAIQNEWGHRHRPTGHCAERWWLGAWQVDSAFASCIPHIHIGMYSQQMGASCCGSYWSNFVPSFWGARSNGHTPRMKDNADFIVISIVVSIIRKT